MKQLKINLGRLTELAGVVRAHKKYVVVNIPAAQVEAIENGNVASRHTGVVGKPDRPTPLVALDHRGSELQSGLAPAADSHHKGSHSAWAATCR